MAIPPRLIASSSSSCTTTSTNNSSIHIEEGLASKFWIKFRRESVFSMYTPFIISLASGTLKIDSFRQYLSQDSHFLKSFAHAFELAEECADDDEAKLATSELRKGVLEELKMQNSFVEEAHFHQQVHGGEKFFNTGILRNTVLL